MHSRLQLAVTELIIQDLIKHKEKLVSQMFNDAYKASPDAGYILFSPSFEDCLAEYWLAWASRN